MPRFSYTAIAADRKTVKGSITAENAYAARKQLRARNLHPTNLTDTSSESEGRITLMSLLGKGRKKEVLEFTKQLATLLTAGIKLTEALSVLIQQSSNARFQNIITDIRDRVMAGESVADTLRDYSDYFDIIYTSMVHVGEVTGTLPASLTTISQFLEKRQRVETKIITVMIYPIILIVVCITALLILTTAVIPKITEQIIKAGQELPFITKMMMGFSYVLRNWWFVILAVLGLIVWGYKRFVSTERGILLRDRLLLSLPIFGPLIRQRVVARFASTLSTLLASGLSMAESLRAVAEVTGNGIMKQAITQARERILAGADITTPLRDSGVISPAMAHMVAVGEKSGELESMLAKISENLESSTDVVIERLGAAVEPLIIVSMAAIVGLIAYATLLPIIRFSAGQF
jgi:general secretion pathway protein F